MTRLERLRSLSGADLLHLAEAILVTLVAEASLAVLTPRRCLSLAARSPGRRPARADVDVLRLARLVEVAGRHVLGRSTCLRRALVLALILRRRGVGASLRIGVARGEQGLLAHAWVETETGQSVGAAGDGREYVCLALGERPAGLPRHGRAE